LIKSFRIYSAELVLFCIALWGCSQPQEITKLISISISADGKQVPLRIAHGSTVQDALQSAGIQLGLLDRVDPDLSALLSDGTAIKVTRVSVEIYTKQVTIPFQHQEMRNEALPEGDRRLSQAGAVGSNEVTYRRVYEDGVEVSNSVVKTVTIQEAIPEIEMVGSRPMFAVIAIPGKIAYLSAGNAWVIQNNTGDRRLVVATGDLDGRVFSLSKDEKYLLFTRKSDTQNTINALWIAALDREPVELIDLSVQNIVHFAEFNPSSNIVAYSTVEWREASPGWQANNDLYELEIDSSGAVVPARQDIPPSSGGVYGWWGTDYSWSPEGSRIIYARPDKLGIYDIREKALITILDIPAYQTGGNWAWVPAAAWSPQGDVIYAVDHSLLPDGEMGENQEFDLIAIPLFGGSAVTLVKDVGMFSDPVPSPFIQASNIFESGPGEELTGTNFTVAYLQALDPRQSETCLYQVFVMDQDGSNRKALFPKDNTSGISPQQIVWSPNSLGIGGNYALALVYNGNIWIIDTVTGAAQQVTGDGLTTRIDWR
jgi:hypothetical protein